MWYSKQVHTPFTNHIDIFCTLQTMFRSEKIAYKSVTVYLLYYTDFDVEDHLHNLLEPEQRKLVLFSHPNRRREYVATRVLRTMVFGNDPILYNEVGAPYIMSEGFVSISHAQNVVGLAFSETHPVGLDLEPIRPKALRVCHKFLSNVEKEKLDDSNVETMIKVWSGKEALYKLAGRKKIIFAKELKLLPISSDGNLWSGVIDNYTHKKHVTLSITRKNEFVISINIDAPRDEY